MRDLGCCNGVSSRSLMLFGGTFVRIETALNESRERKEVEGGQRGDDDC